jgi:peptidyl-prolyl cis-trans isomerase SurA
MAAEYSEDPSAKAPEGQLGHGGNLGYFSVFNMIYPFENPAYTTPVGKVSMPIRTKFGYHLIKVNDKRPAKGKVRVAHIMISAADGLQKKDSLDLKNKADSIYNKLKEGKAEWDEMVQKHSDHMRSKSREGEIAPFSLGGQLGLPTFEKTAFSIEEEGNISEPVKSPYGWHIIKLLEKIEIKPYDEVKDEYLEKVSKGDRAEVNEQALFNKIKSKYGFEVNNDMLDKIKDQIDSSIVRGVWKKNQLASLGDEWIVKFNDKEIPTSAFLEYLANNQRKFYSKSISFKIENVFDSFKEKALTDYQIEQLQKDRFDFAMIVKEYREGIMLFELMEQEVWNKASRDTAGLEAFYNANKEDYKVGKMADATLISIPKELPLKKVYKIIKKADDNASARKEVLKEYGKEINIKEGNYEVAISKPLQKAKLSKTGKLQRIEDIDGFNYVVEVHSVDPNAYKTLSSHRGLIISDYQNHLEKKWIEQLKDKYTVKVHDEEVEKLIQE